MSDEDRQEILNDLKEICEYHPDLRVFLIDPNHHVQWRDETAFSQRHSSKRKTKSKGEKV